MSTTALPGLDLERLAVWLAETRPDLAAEIASGVTAEVIAGGKSNLTYDLRAGSRHLVVRRGPLGHVLATAHDMAREYWVISALAETAVPVPRTVALCNDESVTGAICYVMEYVPGTPYRNAAELSPLGRDRVRRISEDLVDTLVALHTVDPQAVGLNGFGRPSGFLERQTRRWKAQMDGSLRRPMPAADALHGLLVDHLPPEPGPGQIRGRIVHGDYRLDNVLVDDDDRSVAVIDWEMATLGDPLTDLALMLFYSRAGEIAGGAIADAAMAPGFLDEREIVDRYISGSGAELAHLGFYLGLAAYKLAAIFEGIHLRHQLGQTVGAGFDGVGAVTAQLLELGIASMKEHG